MKRLFASIIIFLSAICLRAQAPAPDADTTKDPVKQIDPEIKTEPADIHYIDEMTRITADELPAAVKESIKGLEPNGWKKSVVYRDKKQNTFLIQVREGGDERDYRFSKDGKRLKTSRQKSE
jgi:hypothetical protein